MAMATETAHVVQSDELSWPDGLFDQLSVFSLSE